MNDVLLKAALAALARGWALTPLTGKRPILDAWQARPMPTAQAVAGWVAAAHNLGLRTGPISGVLVVDHDPRHDDGTPLPALPVTVTVNTGGGGTHRYYRCPTEPPPNSSRKIHPALDVKSLGGQVVFVGSLHPQTGRAYVWAPGLDPVTTAMAEVPPDLLARMHAAKQPPVAAVSTAIHVLDNETRTRRARAYLARVPGGVSGEGGSRFCFRAACVLFHGFGLSQDDTFALLLAEYSPRCTPPWSEKELRHKVDDAAKQPGVRGFVLEARSGIPAWATEAAAAPLPARIVLPRRVSKRMLELLRTGRDDRHMKPDGTLDYPRAVFGAAISMLKAGMAPQAVTQAIAASALRGPLLARGPGGLLWMAERVDAARRTLEQDARRRHA